MLSGQKPPFRLLVRAIDTESSQRVSRVQWAVSDAFVVATQRVKGAQKAEIPHIEEHVSKIENVGVQVRLFSPCKHPEALHFHTPVAAHFSFLPCQSFLYGSYAQLVYLAFPHRGNAMGQLLQARFRHCVAYHIIFQIGVKLNCLVMPLTRGWGLGKISEAVHAL